MLLPCDTSPLFLCILAYIPEIYKHIVYETGYWNLFLWPQLMLCALSSCRLSLDALFFVVGAVTLLLIFGILIDADDECHDTECQSKRELLNLRAGEDWSLFFGAQKATDHHHAPKELEGFGCEEEARLINM